MKKSEAEPAIRSLSTTSEQADESRPSVLIDNSGQPIKLSGLQLNGVSAEAARNEIPLKFGPASA